MKRTIPCFILTILTFGCTVGPDYTRPKIEVPGAYRAPAPGPAQSGTPSPRGRAGGGPVAGRRAARSHPRRAVAAACRGVLRRSEMVGRVPGSPAAAARSHGPAAELRRAHRRHENPAGTGGAGHHPRRPVTDGQRRSVSDERPLPPAEARAGLRGQRDLGERVRLLGARLLGQVPPRHGSGAREPAGDRMGAPGGHQHARQQRRRLLFPASLGRPSAGDRATDAGITPRIAGADAHPARGRRRHHARRAAGGAAGRGRGREHPRAGAAHPPAGELHQHAAREQSRLRSTVA